MAQHSKFLPSLKVTNNNTSVTQSTTDLLSVYEAFYPVDQSDTRLLQTLAVTKNLLYTEKTISALL